MTDIFISSFPRRYKVSYNKQTGECRLVISMTFADDAGEYTIVIRNKHGETSASASLLEEGKDCPELYAQHALKWREAECLQEDTLQLPSPQSRPHPFRPRLHRQWFRPQSPGSYAVTKLLIPGSSFSLVKDTFLCSLEDEGVPPPRALQVQAVACLNTGW